MAPPGLARGLEARPVGWLSVWNAAACDARRNPSVRPSSVFRYVEGLCDERSHGGRSSLSLVDASGKGDELRTEWVGSGEGGWMDGM